MPLKITMIGAGSPGFSRAVGRELCHTEKLKDSVFTLMDIDEERLCLSERKIKAIVEEAGAPLRVESTLDRKRALEGCDYVITSCEKERVAFWREDVGIPERHGVHQIMGENGGPGGQIHAMRNIALFRDIAQDMEEICPDAWMMNFTNPMTAVCSLMLKRTKTQTVGLCHQVHGSIGVVAEMLGMEPGDLRLVSAGINHMNWLLDIRRKGDSKSCLDEFLAKVRDSDYWRKNHPNIPKQRFTLEVLDAFGVYPIGYDDHICEYMSFFYERDRWEELDYHPVVEDLAERKAAALEAASDRELMELRNVRYPFPKDPSHPYYSEKACEIINALETGETLYLDSTVVMNQGAVGNLPIDAVVDVPTVTVGGAVHPVTVGDLPLPCAELCHRQLTIYELLVQAVCEGDRQAALQAMCLDPYVRSIRQARGILDDFLDRYQVELPMLVN